MVTKIGFRVGIAAAIGLFLSAQAQAQTPAEFYKGKEIQMLISHPPGGGYDAYARLFARFLPQFMVGNPKVVAQNMPGAAGVVMANSLAVQQRNDGTVIGLGPGALAVSDLFETPGARYKGGNFSWIGSMNADVGVALAWHTAPVKSTADLFTTELITGGAGATDQSVIFPIALNRILGTKFKVIPGYAGSAATALAMERGETSGIGGMNFSSILANKPEWIRDKQITVLVQLALQRHPDLPNVPTVLELAKTEDQRQILELIFSQSDMSRVIFGPPGMPADRLKALRTAFNTMMKDKDFLAEAEKIKMEINNPMSGEDVEKLVNKLQKTKPEIVKQAAEAIRTQ